MSSHYYIPSAHESGRYIDMSCYYICVLILLYIYMSSYYICVLILLYTVSARVRPLQLRRSCRIPEYILVYIYICPPTIYVSSYYYIYICPPTMYVSSYYYIPSAHESGHLNLAASAAHTHTHTHYIPHTHTHTHTIYRQRTSQAI